MMKIRKVKTSELTSVLDLIDTYDRPITQRTSNEQNEKILSDIENNGGSIVGVFIAQQLIGTCTLNINSNISWEGRPYCIIENVIVLESHRNQGIGKKLLSYSEVEAKKLNCYKLIVMTGSKKESTLHFYKNAGFDNNKVCFQKRFVES